MDKTNARIAVAVTLRDMTVTLAGGYPKNTVIIVMTVTHEAEPPVLLKSKYR